jgi:hypothetical protein
MSEGGAVRRTVQVAFYVRTKFQYLNNEVYSSGADPFPHHLLRLHRPQNFGNSVPVAFYVRTKFQYLNHEAVVWR